MESPVYVLQTMLNDLADGCSIEKSLFFQIIWCKLIPINTAPVTSL